MVQKNARVAILEARMSEEMSNLLRRHGAQPYSVPAVREAARDENSRSVPVFIDHLQDERLGFVVFFTGVGVRTLLNEADQTGRQQELIDALRHVTVVCRGPKPAAVLKKHAIPIAYSASEPFTTKELIDVLSPLAVRGKGVGIVHYGERNAPVAQYLRERGAELEELSLYEWQLPDDRVPLQMLIKELIDAQVDAIAFTSQIQVRHLMQVGADMQLTDQLVAALRLKTIVASIGPTCTGVLQEYGVEPHVIPPHPKMGHLVKALQEYLSGS
ncbi:MAG TPA: uroporphyrinogen-III synthase [Dictyobacter sp.]|jgi:uroporphyrinogen-III synthase|nr:uroporphyrinogen-III synthase [Dictyobacter sp.]